jgi:hypothetical protein
MADTLDKKHSISEPSFGSPAGSQKNFQREDSDAGQVTPEANRAGYGHKTKGEGHPMGGHNVDARNQYTVKLKRGSSLG